MITTDLSTKKSVYLYSIFILIIALLPVRLQATQIQSDSEFTISVEPFFSLLAGHTSYVLETDSVKSKLEFPINSLLGGVQVDINRGVGSSSTWAFSLAALTNLSNPFGLMKDHDWYVQSGYPDMKFSYTESEAEHIFIDLSCRAGRKVFGGENLLIRLYMRYCYQYLEHTIDNYIGYQYIWNDTLGAFDLYTVYNDGVPALEYNIFYHRPAVGLYAEWRLSTALSIAADMQAELIYLSDWDDHLLRNKLSTASGYGLGGGAGFYVTYIFQNSAGGISSFFSVDSNISYLQAMTEQTQEWYGDDPTTEGFNDDGTWVYGIDHLVTSLQFDFSVSMGFQY